MDRPADHGRENLLDALRTAIDTGSARTAVQLVSVLVEYWNMSGRPAEAVGWMQAALAVPDEVLPSAGYRRLLLLSLGTLSSSEPGEDARAVVVSRRSAG